MQDAQAGKCVVSVNREGFVSGDEQCLKVGLGSAGSECAVGSCGRPLEFFAEPVQELLLDERGGGRLVPRFDGSVHGAGDGVSGYGCGRDRAVQVGNVVGMVGLVGVVEP